MDDQILEVAATYYHQGDIETAEALCIGSVQSGAVSKDFAALLAAIYMQSGRRDQAVEFIIQQHHAGRQEMVRAATNAILQVEPRPVHQARIIGKILAGTGNLKGALSTLDDTLSQIEKGVDQSTTLILDYPFCPRPRYTMDKPHAGLNTLFSSSEDTYRQYLLTIAEMGEDLDGLVNRNVRDETTPYWPNNWISFLDSASIAAFIKRHRPQRFIEIGSGHSTKMARWAIDRYSPETSLISIDPQPRTSIDALCDTVIRSRLEDVDQEIFTTLAPGDIVFFDGSHRAFENSDVSVFFMEILPALEPGVIVHIHDIFWPADYPENWTDRYYNEQYMLGTLLLNTLDWRVLLPGYYVHNILKNQGFAGWCEAPSMTRFDPLLTEYASCFWLTRDP